MRTEPLGLFAVRRALGRGWTNYGHAGCTQTLAAWRNGWIQRDPRRLRAGRVMDPTLLLNIFEPENAMNHPDHDRMQFRRPKRGSKVHAIEAGPVHDGERYSAAVCGYRPTGENHNSYHDPESTITVDPSTFERRGKGWEAKAAHEREAWTDRETVIVDVHVGSDLPDIVEYGALPAMTLGPKDGFRVIAWRPSGSPRRRDPRLSRS